MFEDDGEQGSEEATEETQPGEEGAEDSEAQGEQDSSEEGDEEKAPAKSKADNGKGKFFNFNKALEALPKDQQETAKKLLDPLHRAMQKSYTQKMQGAGALMRKARAFDELSANPQFQAWINGTDEPPAKKGRRNAEEDDDESGEDSKLTPSAIEKIVERTIARQMSPLIRSEHRKNAAAEWDKLVEDYPQAENYKDEILEVLEEFPRMSYPKAFKMVAFDDARGLGEEETVKKIGNKKAANTGGPSRINPGEKPPAAPKSIREAYQQAVKASKKGR